MAGLLGNLGNFFLGTPAGYQSIPRYSPQQQQASQSILGSGLQSLKNPYQGFEPIKNQAMNTFNQQIIPGLAERFTSGTGGATSSPSLAAQLGQAGSNFGTDLASLQSQFGQQNMGNILQMLQLGLQPEQQYYPVSQQPGFAQSYGPGLLSLLGRGGLAYATGGGSEGIMGLLKAISALVNPTQQQQPGMQQQPSLIPSLTR